MRRYYIAVFLAVVILGCVIFAQPIQPIFSFFTDLMDTPADYSSDGGRLLMVNAGEDAVEFTDEVYIDDVNDRVGIGTATPNNLLQVEGLIQFDDTNYNTLLGTDAFANDNGQHNVGIGYKAGYYNDTTGGGLKGTRNLYIGYRAGYGTGGGATGAFNVGLGNDALLDLITGSYNVAIGSGALTNTVGGVNNMAIGAESLMANISGGYNVGVGTYTLKDNTAYYNTAIGYAALYDKVGGSRNTAIGCNSAFTLTSGASNIFIGYKSGFNQITASNLLIIDNQDRGSVAAEITDALIYGTFGATGQNIRFNVEDFILSNNTQEDNDGGREVQLDFRGEQSGGENTTLARIEASHSGAADDEKGQIKGHINDGDDGDAPTQVYEWDSVGLEFVNSTIVYDVNNVSADLTTFETYGLHIIDSSGAGVTGTLADGTKTGQSVKFVCKVAGNDIDITVSNHVTSDPEVIRLDTAKEWVELVWDGTDWVETDGNGQSYP